MSGVPTGSITDEIEKELKLYLQPEQVERDKMYQKIKETMLVADSADKSFRDLVKHTDSIAKNMNRDPLNNSDPNDPQIFFLGTVSMKPGSYRNASAIYVLHNNHGILMDCAEGSYNQLMEHFGSKSVVDQVLLKTRVIFITHIHGDHQLGVLKVLHERDQLIDPVNAKDEDQTIYVVTPSPMRDWMQAFIDDQIVNRHLVKLVCPKQLNPEKCYYYQNFNKGYTDVKVQE